MLLFPEAEPKLETPCLNYDSNEHNVTCLAAAVIENQAPSNQLEPRFHPQCLAPFSRHHCSTITQCSVCIYWDQCSNLNRKFFSPILKQ